MPATWMVVGAAPFRISTLLRYDMHCKSFAPRSLCYGHPMTAQYVTNSNQLQLQA